MEFDEWRHITFFSKIDNKIHKTCYKREIVIGVCFDLVGADLFRFDLELHHIGSACGSGLSGLTPSAEFASPGLRQQIDNILAEEEEVVQQGHGGGQIQRIGIFQ